MKYLLALLPILLVAGCVSSTGQIVAVNYTNNHTNETNYYDNSSTRTVVLGDHVAVDYTGTLENGTVFDTSSGREPLEFDAGSGQMIKGFDEAVIGMREGEEKTITLLPEQAYGPYDPELIIDVPIDLIPNNTKVGDVLYSGTRSALVMKINSTNATLDLNFPLSGKTLIFKLKVVKIY